MFFTYASLQKSRHWDCRILSFSSSLHKHRGSCRVSSFYIYSSGMFPAGKRLQETRRAEKCQQFARPWQQENEDNQTLAPASAGLAVRCRMPYLNSDCNSWATSATFTWLYSATVLHSSVCPKHRLHSAMSAMSRPCLARMLLLQICKSLLVSEWVATPGTEGECFMALYGEGFSMFVRYHKYIQTHTYFQVFQRVQQPVNTTKKSWTFIGQSWLSYPEILPSGNFAHNVSILPHCSTACCSECRDAVLSHAMSHNFWPSRLQDVRVELHSHVPQPRFSSFQSNSCIVKYIHLPYTKTLTH